MSRWKKTGAAEAAGTALSAVLYTAFQLFLALAAVRGLIPVARLDAAQAVTCALAGFAGARFALRRSALGALWSAGAVGAGFAALLFLTGLLAFNGFVWAGQGGVLAAAALLGGMLAALFGKNGKKRARRSAAAARGAERTNKKFGKIHKKTGERRRPAPSGR